MTLTVEFKPTWQAGVSKGTFSPLILWFIVRTPKYRSKSNLVVLAHRAMNVQRAEIFQVNHALYSAWLDFLLHIMSIPLLHIDSFIPASGKTNHETVSITHHDFWVVSQWEYAHTEHKRIYITITCRNSLKSKYWKILLLKNLCSYFIKHFEIEINIKWTTERQCSPQNYPFLPWKDRF